MCHEWGLGPIILASSCPSSGCLGGMAHHPGSILSIGYIFQFGLSYIASIFGVAVLMSVWSCWHSGKPDDPHKRRRQPWLLKDTSSHQLRTCVPLQSIVHFFETWGQCEIQNLTQHFDFHPGIYPHVLGGCQHMPCVFCTCHPHVILP